MSGRLDANEIVRIIEAQGPLHLRHDGVILVHPSGVYRLDAPTIRRFCAEAVTIDRHAPPREAARAIELLSQRAFDTREYL